MASADRKHLIAACVAAVDLIDHLSPNARLWLARASLHCDPKGRTSYGPTRYAWETGDSETNGRNAIDQLLERGLVVNDHNETGGECWRLCHHDWDRDTTPTIGGYSADAGQKRDGLPAQYGRSVADVIEPPTGKLDFTAPKWDEIREQVLHGQGEEDDPEW